MNRTINDIFFSVVERDQERVMLYKQGSQWLPVPARELYPVDLDQVLANLNRLGG